MSSRSTAPGNPLFVVGSARSGTTLLYHTLLSTGEYAVYRGEPAIYDLVQPRYGDLSRRASRERLLREWPRTTLARASGLDDVDACARVLCSVRSNGDFLRAVMSAVAARQGVARWAVWGPDNLLLMPWIKRELPDARFVHMVRDGRDVALSIGTEGWIHPFPWDRGNERLVAALHWQWKVRRGRRDARKLGADYMELHFETLVSRHEEALRQLSAFLGHKIDPRVVAEGEVGTLRDPNSTFANDRSHPVERWKERLSSDDVARIERAIGPTLEAYGYERATPSIARRRTLAQVSYQLWFEAKHLLRTHSPFGRAVDPRRLRLDMPPIRSGAGREVESRARA